MKKPIYSLLMLLLFSGAFSGCEDILDIEPEEIILEEEAFETEDDLQQFLNSTYDVLANTFDGRSQALSECLTDNLAAPRSNDDLTEVFQRNSNFFNGTINNYYKEPYIVAFRANLLLTKFDLFPNLSETRRVQMEAEARFVRALAHFDVVRLFAQPFGFTPDNGHLGVVLATETFDTPQPRATVRAVYNQIIEDLQFAENALPETNGVYADRNAARALLAKVYFQQNDFVNAADYAAQVINSGRYQLGPLNRYTADPNPESVFATVSTVDQSIGINDVRSGAYTGNYRESNAGGATLNIAADLYAIATADTSDQRAAFYGVTNEGQANQYFWMNKFDADWFNVPILNLTDMKLIRA
ncbi:MAG: RagB/SusD family nutrient uptake outer membrane protein, partial [Bacteroidota bacterium]